MNSSWTTAGALVALAAIFFILALLYAAGTIGFLASSGHKHHYTHAFVMAVLGILSLVGANFLRPKNSADF
ncbi:MAG: hypothetical protein M3Z13_06130 [Candidatus Dormibacteraeota bacterium]|nr:hypothetical protein [Candidatus Dormibacteraeota bacterium]